MKGTKHYIAQRITAIGLLPVALWLVSFFIKLSRAKNIQEIYHLLANPFNGTLLLFFIVVGIYHSRIGLESIIEDYIHNQCLKKTLRIILLLVCIFSALASFVALVYLYALIVK